MLLAPLGATVAAYAPEPACCSFRLDSLPSSFVAGGAPGEFSGSMVNETADRTVGHTLLGVTVKLAGLVPERVRFERQTPDGQWSTLPMTAPGPNTVRGEDASYADVAVAPGTVAGGRYRLTFSATAPIGAASLLFEAFTYDNATPGQSLGRSPTYPATVTAPGPNDLASTLAPLSPAPENGVAGIAGAGEATGSVAPTGSAPPDAASNVSPVPVAGGDAAGTGTSVWRSSTTRWVVIGLGALLVMLLVGLVVRLVRR